MDQAALQRVTLARSSGTLCWTARGAREQQSLRTWIGGFFFGVDGAAGPLGGWVEFVLGCDDAMHCAGIVLRRRHSGSTWTVLQVIFQLGALWLCTFEKLLSSCGRRPVFTQRFAESACCDRIVLPEWRILTGHLPCLMWLSLPLPRSCSPQGGAVQLQSGRQQFTLPAPEPTVLYTAKTFRLELNTWARTCERTLRG